MSALQKFMLICVLSVIAISVLVRSDDDMVIRINLSPKVLNDGSGVRGDGANVPPVTEVCMGCICEASSNCNQTLRCNGDVCGLFRITWAYWSDAGKPTQANEGPDSETAYPNCVNEPLCAARAVQGYMRKFSQDCNGDGIIDCYDYAAIHLIGGYGCKNQALPDKYKSKLDACIDHVRRFQG